MEELSVFDRLSGDLTPSERKRMLERLHRSAPVFQEMEIPAAEETDDDALRKRFSSFSFFRKLVLFLKAVFSGSGLEFQIRKYLLRETARGVESRCPGLADCSRGVLKQQFRNEIVSLGEGSSALTGLLANLNGPGRTEFVLMVMGLLIPELEELLYNETNPDRVNDEFPSLGEKDLRAELERRVEDCFATISSTDRDRIYTEFRFLNALKSFCGFPFHKIIVLFRSSGTVSSRPEYGKPGDQFRGRTDPPGVYECSFFDIRALLPELCSVLVNLKAPASSLLMDVLTLQYVRAADAATATPDQLRAASPAGENTVESTSARRERSSQEFTRKIDAAFQRIASFQSHVPLVELTRIVLEDLSYSPNLSEGGEDWFAVYRQYWKDVLAVRMESFLRERKRKDAVDNARHFLGDRDLLVPENYVSLKQSAGSEPGVRFELCLSFIITFTERMFFSRMNRLLKMLLIDGEFYKEDNRVEYTDAYNVILSIQDRIREFDTQFAPNGEIGTALEKNRIELAASTVKAKKRQTILAAGDREAERLVIAVEGAFASLIRVLDGILNGQAGGRYDTLSNLGYMGGKSSKEYFRGLGRIQRELSEAEGILRTLHDLERYD